MSEEDENKTTEKDGPPPIEEAGTDLLVPRSVSLGSSSIEGSAEGAYDRSIATEGAPTQLGHKRFVYAAYFAGAIAAAFITSKTLNFAWLKLSMWKSSFGEPRDDLVMPIAAVVGVGTAYYYWKRTRARELAEEVASELSQVTWPSKHEVTNSTAVVIVTTAIATVFFALMDRFWGFVTNLVYGS